LSQFGFFPLLEWQHAVLFASSTLFEDALARHGNQGNHEHDEEQRSVIRAQLGKVPAELTGPLARVNALFAVVPGADAVVNMGHNAAPRKVAVLAMVVGDRRANLSGALTIIVDRREIATHELQ